jgi:hypothetical protein
VDGFTLAQIEENFLNVLRTILSYQEKGDYLGIADKIEYELLTNLCMWAEGLRVIRRNRASNG